MKNKISEMFEGENSSLRKAYDEAVYTATPEIPKDMQKYYDWGYEQGRKDAEEEMGRFIIKNFYNEKTCKKINKFLNK